MWDPLNSGGSAGATDRSIRIFLSEISNWTGAVLVAPRSQLDQLSKREEVRRTGVYLLVGPDPDDPSRALASIGEGDNVLKRSLRHDKNEAKDFWERRPTSTLADRSQLDTIPVDASGPGGSSVC